MPRFVILEHDHPELHWDLMLEAGDVLRTWRLAAPPWPGERVRAEASFDHRTRYLDYEGPVSGNRGTVTAWDRGTFEAEAGALDPKAPRITFHMAGERARGFATLEPDGAGEWWFRAGGAGGSPADRRQPAAPAP